MQRSFSEEKLAQILNHLHCNNTDKALMLIYFADRHHLRNYGILMTYDEYIGYYGKKTRQFLLQCPRKSREDNTLSISNKLSMDFAKRHFGCFSCSELVALAQDYGDMESQDFFNPPASTENIQKYLHADPYKEDAEILKYLKQIYLDFI